MRYDAFKEDSNDDQKPSSRLPRGCAPAAEQRLTREQQLVNVTITDVGPPESWLDTECLAACAGEADDAVTLEEVRAGARENPRLAHRRFHRGT